MAEESRATGVNMNRRHLLALVLTLTLLAGCNQANSRPSLLVYCAAVARPPMEAIAARYQAEHGVVIELQFAGSGALISQAEISQQGDLILPAGLFYVETLRSEGLVIKSRPIASLLPVIIANPDTAPRITSLQDLLHEDLRLALANPDTAAVGAVTKRQFEQKQKWADIKRAVESRGVFTPTVSGVANAVELGGADAGIVWDAMTEKMERAVVVPLPAFSAAEDRSLLEIAVLSTARDRAMAAAFMNYVADEGRSAFAKRGFGPPGHRLGKGVP